MKFIIPRAARAFWDIAKPVLKFIQEGEEYDVVIKHGLEGYEESID